MLFLFLLFSVDSRPSFNISNDGSTFLQDGQPYRIVAAGFHYFRAPAAEWEARFQTIAVSGVNAVQTYIAWNYHCPDEHLPCTFSGDQNISYYFHLAAKYNLKVVLRPGPFICAEWDFGGFPAWILRNNTAQPLRLDNPQYMAYVTGWWGTLLPLLQPHLYANGGSIVLFQIENEYGSYSTDIKYLESLLSIAKGYLGDKVIYYSTDGDAEWYLQRSAFPGIFQVVDFGPGADAAAAWKIQATFAGKITERGPPMCDEFYTGWLPTWFDKHIPTNSISSIVNTVDDMLIKTSNHSNMNFYMFFGGSNFGFWASWQVCQTYGYNAPVNESGHVTPLYEALYPIWEKVFPSFKPVPNVSQPYALIDVGAVQFSDYAWLPSLVTRSEVASKISHWQDAPTMEQAGVNYGYIGYQLRAGGVPVHNMTLQPHDYAAVYCDGVYSGFLWKPSNSTMVNLCSGVNVDEVLLIVENTGRVSFFGSDTTMIHTKGLRQNVILNGISVQNYTVYNWDMPHARIQNATRTALPFADAQPGTFYFGTLQYPAQESAGSMIDMRRWGKGFVFLNERNLGRYWPIAGPQYSIYVPPSYFLPGRNDIIIYEQTLAFNTPPPLHFTNVNYNV